MAAFSSMHRALRAVAGVACVGLSIGVSSGDAADVVVQDGYSFSGAVEGAPIGTPHKLKGTSSWAPGVSLGSFAFRSGIYDGSKVWLLPADADHLVTIEPATGLQSAVSLPDLTATAQRFAGGVFDGTSIFLVPFDADRVVAVDASTGATVEYSVWPDGFTKGNGAFAGGVFDGTHVWLLPHNADRVIRLDPADGSMSGFDGWPTGFAPGPEAFWGGVFDGRYIWMVPYSADSVIRLDTNDGSMSEIDGWPAGFSKGERAFAGAAFDGASVWMAPYDADQVVLIEAATGTMTAVDWPAEFSLIDEAFAGAVYDGDDVWLVPFDEDRLVRINAASKEVTPYSEWPASVTPTAGSKFAGAVFDGTRIFLAPAEQTVLVTISPDDPARLINISSRAIVGTGDQVLIPGFVISGTGSKKVLVRGIGPGLADFGVQGELAVPTLTLHDAGGAVASNTGWETSADAAEIASVGATVGAFPLMTGNADCALIATLSAGPYTAHLSGEDGTTGVGLVEVYDADETETGTQLTNVSARAQVGVGDEVLIPGFAMSGRETGRLLIRAIGPGLSQFGVQGVLEDPTLTVFSGADEIETNDDWQEASNAEEIASVASTIGAFALEDGSKDAAVLIDLPPSGYTVRVSGVGGTSGVANVEVYFVE